MYNMLKRQNKFLMMLNSILISLVLFSNEGIAEKSSKRSSSSRVKRAGKNANKTPIKKVKETISENKVEEKSEVVKDTSNITKYNCEILYNKCMNQKCYSNTNGRCSCNEQNKFALADNECKYIYNACPNLADNIVATFKRNAKSDCSNFTIADMKESQTALSNIVAELKACMKPKCKSRSMEFLGCFDEDNLEKKLKNCEKVFANVDDKESLKGMFKDSLKEYKKKFCNDIYGTLKDDGECYLTIGFGPSFKDIKKKKEFKIGDNVFCSEEEFDIKLGESKHQKLRYAKEIALTGIDIAKGIANMAMDIKSGSANALEITSQGLNTLVGSQHLGGAIEGAMMMKYGDFSYSGYCYVIKGTTVKELFGASDEYYYKLRWGEDWNSVMSSKEETEE